MSTGTASNHGIGSTSGEAELSAAPRADYSPQSDSVRSPQVSPPALDLTTRAPPTWRAEWLYHPLHPYGVAEGASESWRNLHFLFRGRWQLGFPSAAVREAALYVVADDTAKLWLN